MAGFWKLPRAGLQQLTNVQGAVEHFSPRFLRESSVFPFRLGDDGFGLAVSDPADGAAIRAAEIVCGRPLAIAVASFDDIATVLELRLDERTAEAVDLGEPEQRTGDDDIDSLRDLAKALIAREHARGPLVRTRPLVRVPGPRIACAVIDEVELRVVGNPAPHGGAADLPRFRRPALDAEVGSLVGRIERLEIGPISTSLSGPVLNAFHASFPLFASSAAIQPRTPNSPPELPTSTLPFTTSGAMVMLSPLLMSPSFVFQSCLPVSASTAMVLPSRVLMMTLPCQYTAPRLTTSQHATPCAAASGCGSVFPLLRRAGLGEVQRVEDVGVRRHDVHRVADDDRRRLLAAVPGAGGKGEFHLELADVGAVDLVERAESRARRNFRPASSSCRRWRY